jgi:copper oxidase (laccase) domain-containing protein
MNHMQWLNRLPNYYHFQVHANEVLLFNNCMCIHKFENLIKNEEIYTIRLLSSDCSPLIFKKDIFNWQHIKHSIKISLMTKYNRDPALV